MPPIEKLTNELAALEEELCGALVEVHTMRYNTLQENMAPSRESLTELKAVVDRLRPLLWVWMHRLPAGASLPQPESAPVTVA